MPFDRTQDRLLALGQHSQAANSVFNRPNLLLIHAAGLVFPVARDEGNRVTGIQQADQVFDTVQRDGEAAGDATQINRRGETHSETSIAAWHTKKEDSATVWRGDMPRQQTVARGVVCR